MNAALRPRLAALPTASFRLSRLNSRRRLPGEIEAKQIGLGEPKHDPHILECHVADRPAFPGDSNLPKKRLASNAEPKSIRPPAGNLFAPAG
jgi:hypothetical protein